MILNRIELGTECTVRESGNKGVLKKIYFYPTKYEIEFPNGSVEHYSSKDIDFQGITQKPVKRRVPEVPSFGLIEKWSDGTLSDSESLLSYHFSTTKEIMWKMITSIETYNVWFYGIQRALPVLESERYVHKYSFNQLDLKPGSFFKIRPRTIAPYFKCRIMTFEYEKEFGFTFQTTPFSIEYVQFSLKTSKSGVIVHCSRVSSGGFSFLNQINWKEKSKIFNKLDEIIPKVKLVEEDSLKSEENTTTKKRIVAPSLSKDDIVAVLVNKVLDGNTEAMDIEKSKVIRGKAKAMIVKIKRGSAERPPMPKVPTSEPSSTGNVESLSKENQIALYVNKGLDGDMDSINNLQDKVIRAKVKAMIVKIKRGSAERPPMPKVPTSEPSSTGNVESLSKENQIALYVNKGLDGDMDSINNLQDKVIRAKVKAMIVKIKRGSAERPSLPLIDNNSSKNEAESVNEKIIRLVSNGIKGEMDEINSLKDPILKGKIKASIMKEKRKQK